MLPVPGFCFRRLTIMMSGSSNIMVKDSQGDAADIAIADVTRSNGVVQVIDKVLLPAR